jgi:hypothetical protein
MARSRTLANLRADVRERADMVGSTFITDATLNEYINQSAARLYNKLVAARGHSYYQTTYSFTTTSATLYALPADFWELQLAYIDYGGGRKQTMRPFMMRELARWSEQSPQAGYTVYMRYTPAPVRMVADGDTFDGIAGWEEWIVLDAAIKALNKEESDTTVLGAQRADIEADITALAGDRDAIFPDRITDVERMRDISPYQNVPRYRIAAGNIEILWGPNVTWDSW